MPKSFYSPWSYGRTTGATQVAAPVAVATWVVPTAAIMTATVLAAPVAIAAWTVPPATIRMVINPDAPIEPIPYVELELDGFDQGWTDVAADCELAYGITIQWGIDGGGPKDLVARTGTARFVLDNSERNSIGVVGYYSLYNVNRRAGWALGIRCRIRFRDPNTSIYHTRFLGRIDAIDPRPGVDGPLMVAVTATDWIDEAARFTLTPAIGKQENKRWNEVIDAILAEMPRQPDSVSLDNGGEAYPFALDTTASTGQPALSEFVKLASSEFGLIYQKADGMFRAENRHARMLRTGFDWILDDSQMQDLSMPSTRDEVINTVRVIIHPKKPEDDISVVYDQASVITLTAGETKLLLGSFRDPISGDAIGATNVQPPVAGLDYIANTLPDGSGSPASSLLTVVVELGQSGANFSITNNHSADLSLTRNQLRGQAIKDRDPQTFTDTDDASVEAIGVHDVEFDMAYQHDDDVGRGAALYLKNKYSSAMAQARTIRVLGDTPELLTQILARDISDRIAISEAVSGLNSTYFINGGELRYLPSRLAQATYTLAPAQDPFAGLYWILGTSALAPG